MNKTRMSAKVLSFLLAVVMLVGIVSINLTASAVDYESDDITLTPMGGWEKGDTVISNGHRWECTTWWITTPPPGSNWADLGPVSEGSKVPVPDQIMVNVVSTGDKVYMGYGTQHEIDTDEVGNTLHNYAPCKGFTMKKGEMYVVYMTAQIPGKWYFGEYDDCVKLTLTDKGLEYVGAKFGWATGLVPLPTNNYSVSLVGKSTVEIKYKSGFGNGTITWEGTEGEDRYVSDETLNEWAELSHDAALSVDGAARQTFSVNSVKNFLAAWGAPARSVAPEFQDPATQAYYKQCKVDNAQYMRHENYQYSEYFLHDYVAQGVWDAMPATYGWKQDEYTTPGKVIMKKHPEIQGKAYAIALGGQNPYILCDFLERYANVVGEDGTYESSTTNPDAGKYTNANGWFKGYDEEASTAYLWNPTEGVFLGYENSASWHARADYIEEKDLGGVIIWEISGDDKLAYNMTKIFGDEVKAKGKEVIAYFCNWSVYNDYHQKQTPKDLPWDYLTMVNYSFFQIGGYDTGNKDTEATPYTDLKVHTIDAWADDYTEEEDVGGTPPNMLLEMAEESAKHPDVKIMFSIGGWTRGDGFAAAVETQATRKELIDSIVAFIDKYPFFSGVDLDWEYPATGSRDPDFDDCADMGCPNSSNDQVNFPAFVRELRQALDSKYGAGKKLITSCFNGAPEKLAKLGKPAIESLSKDLTYFNMMTYDYHGAFDPTIGYNTLLKPHKATPDEWCTANTVEEMLNEYKIPSTKINIGAALYSRGWAGVIPDENMNPQPLDDRTPIFGDPIDDGDDGDDVEEDKFERTIVMKKNLTNSWVDGEIRENTKYENGAFAMALSTDKGYLLPVRFVAEKFRMTVNYKGNGVTEIINDATKESLIVTKGSNIIKKYNADGTFKKDVQNDAITESIDTITYVPLRAVSEALGLGVAYRSTPNGSYVVIATDKNIDANENKVQSCINAAVAAGLK